MGGRIRKIFWKNAYVHQVIWLINNSDSDCILDFIFYSNSFETWKEKGGALITNYEKFKNLLKEATNKASLVDPGPLLLFCDEAHKLKNKNTQIYQAVKSIQTKKKILLTGTPMQNHMEECKYTNLSYCVLRPPTPHSLYANIYFNVFYMYVSIQIMTWYN